MIIKRGRPSSGHTHVRHSTAVSGWIVAIAAVAILLGCSRDAGTDNMRRLLTGLAALVVAVS
jgi:hypothetical protein